MKGIYCLLIALFVLSCNDNKDALLIVSSTHVTLSNSNPYAEITIVKGGGNYRVTTSNEAVAKPLLVDNKLYIIGHNIGSATITLIDNDNNQVNIKVTINEYILRVVPLSNLLFVKIGDTKSIITTDSNPMYSLIDSVSVINVAGVANNLEITGLKKGFADLYYLKDYWPTMIYNIQVVDHYLFSVSPSTNSVRLFAGAETEYSILSGSGDYTITISDENVISAEFREWPMNPDFFYSNPRIVHIKAHKSGSSELTITDVETSEVKLVMVTVR